MLRTPECPDGRAMQIKGDLFIIRKAHKGVLQNSYCETFVPEGMYLITYTNEFKDIIIFCYSENLSEVLKCILLE